MLDNLIGEIRHGMSFGFADDDFAVETISAFAILRVPSACSMGSAWNAVATILAASKKYRRSIHDLN